MHRAIRMVAGLALALSVGASLAMERSNTEQFLAYSAFEATADICKSRFPGKFDNLPEKLLAWRNANPIRSEAISQGRQDFDRDASRDENLRKFPLITLGVLAAAPDQKVRSECERMKARPVEDWLANL